MLHIYTCAHYYLLVWWMCTWLLLDVGVFEGGLRQRDQHRSSPLVHSFILYQGAVESGGLHSVSRHSWIHLRPFCFTTSESCTGQDLADLGDRLRDWFQLLHGNAKQNQSGRPGAGTASGKWRQHFGSTRWPPPALLDTGTKRLMLIVYGQRWTGASSPAARIPSAGCFPS